MQWVVFLVMLLLYVHLFNAIAKMYFDSDQKMTWKDLYRKVMPPIHINIQI